MFPFNVRVYGLLITEGNEVLVSDELIRGHQYTKFPGGGLEFGEGTRDCLRREFLEELNLPVEVGEHLYTTDFFQVSAWNGAHQILSIYYFVKPMDAIRVPLNRFPFEGLATGANEAESFRLIPMDAFSPDSMSLPIDKVAAGLAKEVWSSRQR
jgi:8-oxo-dGTP diphosphatase